MTNKIKIISIICLLSFCFGKNLTLETRINPPARELMDIFIGDSIMIIPGNLDGYDFYDISDPAFPIHISNLEIPFGNNNRAQPGFWVVGNDSIAFITSRNKGNKSAIINFSNPENPVNVGALSFPGINTNGLTLEGLDLKDNLLAVAAHEDGVFVFDIQNHLAPELIYEFQCSNAWDALFVDTSKIIIGNGEEGLIFYELLCTSDSCTEVYLPTNGSVKDIELRDSLLYVAEGSGGVSVYDISEFNSPILLGNYDTNGLSNKISMVGENRVAVSDWIDVKILEWDGTDFQLVGYKSTGKRTMAIASKDSVIFSAEWQHLQTFIFQDIADPDIDISSWDISFPYLDIGESDTLNILIENNGQFPLGIAFPTPSHPDFQIVNFPEYLDAFGSNFLQIVYTRSNQNASGTVALLSNDPDETEIIIQLVGNYDGGIVGIDAPGFSLPVVANGTGNFVLSEHIGKIVVIAFFAPG